jgi:tetratricopeptide (TPR) repeat protein
LAEELNNQTEMARAHKGTGTALAYQERYPAALKEIAESYSIYSAQGDQLNAGYSQIARADALWHLGRYEEARAALSQVASVAEQPGGEFRPLWLRINLTRAHMALSEMSFLEAVAKGHEAVAADDSKIREAATEATYVIGLARARAGALGDGMRVCAGAVEMAKGTGDPRLHAEVLLAFAEALLSRDAQSAVDNARTAADIFTRIDKPESAWRASLVAGVASQRLGDNRGARAYLSQASGLLAGLAQRWSAEDFEHYLTRPDIARQRKQLNEVSAAVQ